MANVYVFLVLTFILIAPRSTFILDGQKCIAYPPCTCSSNYVYCNSKSLTTFPKFEVSNITGSYVYLHMENNQLASIPANAFRNLTVSNSTNIYLYINDNQINDIATNAFTGIADRDIRIYISSNNLTLIPTAFKTLKKLNYLDILGNPISTLSSSVDVLHSIKDSLRTFYIDLTRFTAWPSELKVLSNLEQLYIRFLNLTHLDFDAFQGFENTLKTLSIQYSQLERVPIAVCHLKNLQTLTFSNNRYLHTNSSIIEPCKPKLTSVTSVDLSSNNLRYMPDILRNFPSLQTLTLNYNDLSYIHWDSVPGNSPLQYLYMDNNDFTRIPSVVNKLHSLYRLEMNYNKITSIEDSDLSNLSRLQYLYLNNNPIEYISPHAFKNNNALYYIHLQNTKIRELPNSLAGLQNLRYLYLYGTQISCDCHLDFMQSLNISLINIYGNCHSSSTSIKTYLINDLPRCP